MTNHEHARAQIRPVKQRVEDDLIARPGVIGVDIGEKVSKGTPTGEQAIVVYVESKKPKSKLGKDELIPAEIDGVKTDVVEEQFELQPAAVRLDDATLEVDAGRYTTLEGGISIGPARSVYMSPPDVPSAGYYVFVGTLGAMVKDRASGAMMALTNFHVACVDTGWHSGDVMVQPGRNDGGTTPANDFGTLTRATLSEHVDGAVITVNSGISAIGEVVEIGEVAGSGAATGGQAVRKRGRTTGLTYGSIGSTDFTISIPYGDGLGTRTLKNQLRIDTDNARSARFSDHGDSGSVVVDDSRNVLGLLFGGANSGAWSAANPIQFVLDELGVDLYLPPVIQMTRAPICDVVTRAVACQPTRITLCNFATRSPICVPVTRPQVCWQLPTRSVSCFISRTVICQMQVPQIPDLPGPGPLAGESPYGDGYEEIDQVYWAGYLAALADGDQMG